MTTLTFTSIASASDIDGRSLGQKMVAATTAAVRAAIARAKARRDYRYMLEACDDHILKDVGLSRDVIREAYDACGHRG